MRVVFVPGMATNQTLWQGVIRALAPGVQTSCVDFSECVDEAQMLSRINDVAVDKRVPTILAGFSMGGYLSIEYLLKHGLNSISSLVLINASGSGYNQAAKLRRQRLLSDPDIHVQWNSPERLSSFFDESHPDFKAHLKMLKTMTEAIGYSEFERQQVATMNRVNRLLELKRITIPTMVIYATEDRLVSRREVDQLINALPDARLMEIGKAGHMLPLQQPYALAECINEWIYFNQHPKGSHHVSRPSN